MSAQKHITHNNNIIKFNYKTGRICLFEWTITYIKNRRKIVPLV